MKDELKVIKEQLDKHVFSNHEYQSQKEQIINRIKKKPKKPKKLLHTIAAVAAVLLFSIISVPYILQGDSNTPAQNNENPPELHTPNEQQPIVDEKKEQNTEEEPTPPQQEKTGDEWISQFKERWNSTQQPYQKLQLAYTSNFYDRVTLKKTFEVSMGYKNGELIYVSDAMIERPQGKQHLETIINGNQLTLVDHDVKNFENIELAGTAIEIYNDPTIVNLEPLSPLTTYDSLFTEAYSWEVEEVDEIAGWVRLHATLNPRYQDYTRTKANIKIDLDTGIILELTTHAGEKVFEELFVDKIFINDEVDSPNLDTTIPSGYVNLNKVRNERVKIDSKWEAETNRELKKEPQISREGFFVSGEDAFISFILKLKEGTSEQKAKELAQRLVNVYTEKANSSTELKQRGVSIWDQYTFNIFVIIEPSQDEPTYNGEISKNKQNGIPLIKWN
ncbi:hypothetical protein [Bacillus timonensis]|uniref:hypothetical protein n=1 Tax=Bacillus timonensis TaxID=1033734 RepID=UPI00028A10C2|nr:hypothetical protein [Bacillus timonensis]